MKSTISGRRRVIVIRSAMTDGDSCLDNEKLKHG